MLIHTPKPAWPQLRPCSNPRTSLYTIPQCVRPRVGAFLVWVYKGGTHHTTFFVRVNSTENDRRLSPDQDLNLMPFSWLYQTQTPGHRAGTGSAIARASNSHTNSVLLNGDVMAVVIKQINLETAMNVRAVCKSWCMLVKDAKLEPLEAGYSKEEMARGIQRQKDLEQALVQENEVWTSAYTRKLAQYLERQEEITAEMRHRLVNWLIEIHFKFKCHRQLSLYLSIKLVDLFLAYNEVRRVTFQNVGVSAFSLACKCEEDFCPKISDLSYCTNYSSSQTQITDMEKNILTKFKDNLEHPNPTTCLFRFSEAAKLNFTKPEITKYSKNYSIALYFIDILMLDASLVTICPSLTAAAAIMCTLRVLGRSDWNKQLDHYTTYTRETVAKLADQLIANGRASTPSAIKLKYTSQRLGGKSDQVGADGKPLNDGCLHVIANYYAQL